MFPGYRLQNREIRSGLVLAPMSGVTCSSFRRLIRELNPTSLGLVMSEFISVEALTRRVPRALQMMRFDEQERPVAIQIFGYDIQRMRDGALMAQDAGADVVDINCGCPAPKVVRKGGGCELMRQPQQVAKILREVRRALSVPLTLKMRSGWDEGSKNAVEVAQIAEAEGVQAIAIHGRTKAQMYRGEADWEVVYQVAAKLRIPVFGSGDVVDRESALRRLYPTGETKSPIAGLYIGRAALSNPFIFEEIYTGCPHSLKHNESLVLKILTRYAQLLQAELSPKACIGRMKQLVSQMCRGYAWRRDILMANDFQFQLNILMALTSTSQPEHTAC